MKPAIHPVYHDDCLVTCACGNKFTTGSTLEKIEVEICSKCHPFFTGQQKFVDIKGRIDKFKEKQAQGVAYKAKKEAKVAKKVKEKKSN
ncbi:MAG: Ribosomal protein L31 (Modular protein) [Candidatus Shapirobacteria bacterium GW2011_GWE1_38_10]|uniref:Large ribosomal subunit protein bL31 n=1 Tax=Candidatus Shapirobacteria bacterium GW2011_GWE1_38_10 TaxID=1618488 RepID=A0A0G0I7D1_9BACT|nr:MAG: Ribosomal protein L31 (Modular protein) [Candidatus Shapirobacteria bacterium GW2011_GWF2_37_20]KKQ50457.1 MAG: Ribosomal protein L31 (Modular protein) [Candidatus Shapirobacteria bacterium GW2011_GWE1_38_10]KKQ65113.1 MAG: Ribosomal protein L31 (Modular protein) [Candidatus Shapirobacteria bacterium GW2011_GWF1_38_23]HBP50870.1 50S ribosomal protein L31 [Candidatus Shapirobacteria bacterium]